MGELAHFYRVAKDVMHELIHLDYQSAKCKCGWRDTCRGFAPQAAKDRLLDRYNDHVKKSN